MIEQDIKQLTNSLANKSYEPPIINTNGALIGQEKLSLQYDLASETLQHAYDNVPYYRQTWDKLGLSPKNFRSLGDLNFWPILRKADVYNNRSNLVSKECDIIGYRCTTGTTGLRMPLAICREEVNAINDFSRLKGLVSGQKSTPPIVLQVAPPVRRISTSTGGSGHGPVITTYLNLDAASHRFEFDYVDHIIQCLVEEFPRNSGHNRAEVLWTCPTFMVKTLTDSLKERNFNPADCDIKNIVCSGGIITKGLCTEVKNYWNVELSGFYSMSEIAGSHKRNNRSGDYHFDTMAYAEIVDPITREPVKNDEEGVLILTSLYPFQQAQPMIRYWTGDVFTKRNNGLSGTFRGRLSECIDLSEIFDGVTSPRFLGSSDILEILGSIKGLPTGHKNPKFHLELQKKSPQRIGLTVESYPSSTTKRRQIESTIKDLLTKRIIVDDCFIAADLLDIKLVDKGSMSSIKTNYYPDR